MTDSHQPSTTAVSERPYPEWVAVPPPWAAPTPPPDGPPPHPPAPPPAPPARWGRSALAAALAASLVVGAVAGVVSRWRWHGVRPTLNTASPSVPAAPSNPAPVAPSSPTSPFSGGGSPSAGTAPTGPTAALAAKVTPGVVDINTKLGYQSGSGAGTGMVLTPSGEILTNNHVVEGATHISVTLVDTGRTYNAAVVGTDPTDDIAIIQIQGASGLKTIPIGNSSAVTPGDSVVAIGNAGGVGGAPAVVTGTVQAVNQTITAGDFGGSNSETLTGLIQTNAPLQPGDSGGPLVNSAGQVIGMNTAASAGRRFRSGASVGFAIPTAHALSVAHQIESGQVTSTVHLGLPAFLGVALDPAGQGSGSSSGATISGVEPGLPAAGAGLTAGDTIVSLDGHAVDSSQTLSGLMKAHKPGDKVALGWSDSSGRRHSATVTLAAGPAD